MREERRFPEEPSAAQSRVHPCAALALSTSHKTALSLRCRVASRLASGMAAPSSRVCDPYSLASAFVFLALPAESATFAYPPLVSATEATFVRMPLQGGMRLHVCRCAAQLLAWLAGCIHLSAPREWRKVDVANQEPSLRGTHAFFAGSPDIALCGKREFLAALFDSHRRCGLSRMNAKTTSSRKLACCR